MTGSLLVIFLVLLLFSAAVIAVLCAASRKTRWAAFAISLAVLVFVLFIRPVTGIHDPLPLLVGAPALIVALSALLAEGMGFFRRLALKGATHG